MYLSSLRLANNISRDIENPLKCLPICARGTFELGKGIRSQPDNRSPCRGAIYIGMPYAGLMRGYLGLRDQPQDKIVYIFFNC